TDDVPFSEEMFPRLGDTYRRIRNTLSILLGNLYDFPLNPSSRAQRSEVEGARDETIKVTQRDSSTSLGITLIDRWILERLDHVIADCRSAYEAFEFHKVYHILNQFCAVDLSSLYIDITKDRMECDTPDSPRRRATQLRVPELLDALCRLLAPILAFTAEEAWRHSVPTPRDSVHLQEFPQSQDRHGETSAQVAELLRLRGVIAQAIERARQEKLIGNTLEARVVLHSDSDVTQKVP